MKKFEPFAHTADIGGRVYGGDIQELFVNAVEMLYSLSGVVWHKELGKELEIEISAGSIEELLVKFLNELIYYMDVKKTGGEIKKLSIEKKGEEYTLYSRIDGKNLSIGREIKAATYHNLKVKEEKGFFIG